MTVGELIEQLKQFPAELPVVVNGGRNEMGNGKEARSVFLWHLVVEPACGWCPESSAYGWLDDPEGYADSGLGVYRIEPVVNVSAGGG
jgi:hypothetical protein